ncbi:MAG: hypothetical protein H7Y15_09560 [Pseudonocardia sp.]|nr:hypothetical protein [Pseudonocardia sp.]
MGVVSTEQFNRFLSSPQWTPEQWEAAGDVLNGTEANLASALYGTRIATAPMTEAVPVIAKSGQVATSFPVSVVTSVNGAGVPDGAVAPVGWRLDRHRLYRVNVSALTGVSMLSGLGTRVAAPYAPYDEVVTVSYLGGWGPEPDLVLAIMRKAKMIFLNNHDDSVSARAMSGDAPAPLPEEKWTDDELAPLGRFRRLDLP